MTGSSIYKMCLLGEVAADMGLAQLSQAKHGQSIRQPLKNMAFSGMPSRDTPESKRLLLLSVNSQTVRQRRRTE
jgi:hypothetical protein